MSKDEESQKLFDTTFYQPHSAAGITRLARSGKVNPSIEGKETV
ncbi:MAG TPA: hypothetical protein VNK70_01285 [Candidatus Paceibacterota bacterium]|nr:hypothetical protein [Candidatus Paceibacterota bacterium]